MRSLKSIRPLSKKPIPALQDSKSTGVASRRALHNNFLNNLTLPREAPSLINAPVRLLLSLTPRFSGVGDTLRDQKPFQRFLAVRSSCLVPAPRVCLSIPILAFGCTWSGQLWTAGLCSAG